jgi:hypothetical protein
MLEALAIFDRPACSSFGNRTFDVPLMETRWAFHRREAPTDGLPHFDMLPPARRLWGRRDESLDRSSCTLSSLERSVLGFHRIGDVPGFEIPARYFHFLRTGDGAAIAGVLEHNRHDLVSLAGVMAQALALAEEGPEACRRLEQLASAYTSAVTGRGRAGATRRRGRRSGRPTARARAPGRALRQESAVRRGGGRLAGRAGSGAAIGRLAGARAARGGSARDSPRASRPRPRGSAPLCGAAQPARHGPRAAGPRASARTDR